jgi:4-amino-4-deoxy-L-arabinose transferase-like glycosyltransferase
LVWKRTSIDPQPPEESVSRLSSLPAARRLWQRVPREAWWIILAGVALRVLFFFIAQNAGMDALARAQMVEEWLKHPDAQLVFAMWLPFHFWLMAGLSVLVRSVVLGSRLLSLLLGIASLGAFWALAREVFGSAAAKLSLLVFAFYSLHIGYGTTSSSEVPYMFFVLTALWGFFVYRRSGAYGALALGAAALGIGAGFRYEAWLFIFAVFLILLFLPSQHARGRFWGTAHVYEVSLFGGIAGLWPLICMIYQWKLYGMPLYGVTMNYTWAAEQFAEAHRSLLYILALFPGVILLTLTPVALAAGFYGLVRGLRQRPGRDFGIIFLIVGIVTGYQVVAGGLLPQARYTLTVGTLLALTSGYGLEQVAGFLWQRRARRLRLAVGLLMVLNLGGILILSRVPNPFNDKFRSISPDLRFTRRIETIGQYLKPRIGPNTSVVIDNYNSEPIDIAHVIGLPLVAGKRAYSPTRNDLAGLVGYMEKEKPSYLIYSDRGILPTLLPLPNECRAATAMGMKFQCLFENDAYRIYSVGYQPAPATSDQSTP